MSDKVADFEKCTDVVSILYRGFYGKDIRLTNGLEITMSPANRQLFYVTVFDQRSPSSEGETINFEIGGNQIWVAPEGIHKNPSVVTTGDSLNVDNVYSSNAIGDGNKLRFHLDENKVPTTICRSAYKQGVFCYDIDTIEDFGVGRGDVAISAKPSLVVPEDVVDSSCTFSTSNTNYESFKSGIATGFEVFWDGEGKAEKVVFGCYGYVLNRGNMTTYFRDGTVVQTLQGAYPGSVLIGKALPNLQGDGREPTNTGTTVSDGLGKDPLLLIIAIFFLFIAIAIPVCRKLWRKLWTRGTQRLDETEEDLKEDEESSTHNESKLKEDEELSTQNESKKEEICLVVGHSDLPHAQTPGHCGDEVTATEDVSSQLPHGNEWHGDACCSISTVSTNSS